MNYLLYTFGAMLAWGFWGFFPRLAVARLDATSAQIWNWLGASAVALPCAFLLKVKFGSTGDNSYLFGALAGACGMVGGFMYNKGLSLCGPNTAAVIGISALYPVISILLTVLVLKQKLNAGQVVGIVLCISGALVLATYSQPEPVSGAVVPAVEQAAQP